MAAEVAPAASTPGVDAFVLVWMELLEIQHRATQAVTALRTPKKPERLRKFKSALELQQRVKALMTDANELLYTHLLPTPSTAKVTERQAVGSNASSQPQTPAAEVCSCCCCCKSKHGADSRKQEAEKTRSRSKKSRSREERGTDSEDSGADQLCSDGDEAFERAYQQSLKDVKLHQSLLANRRRSTRVFERNMSTDSTGSPTRGKRRRRPSTPRGRSPAGRDDVSVGGTSMASTTRQQYRKYSSASPARTDDVHGVRKRKRSPAERQPSPAGQDDPYDDRISKRNAAKLTVEKVLGSRKNSSQREFKIKWVELVKPSWITRRKCQPQVLKAIEEYVRAQEEASQKSKPKGSSQSKSGTDSEDMYTVEKLIGVRKKQNKVQYLVRWDGYDSSEDTWEDASELRKYVPEIVDEYEVANRRSAASAKEETKTGERDDLSDVSHAKKVDSVESDGNRSQAQQDRVLDDNIDEDGPMGHSEDEDGPMGHSEDDDQHCDVREGAAKLVAGGRFSKPLFVVNSQHADSSDGEHAHGAVDEDDDENGEVSDDFSGEVRFGVGRSDSAAVLESTKELLRRVRE